MPLLLLISWLLAGCSILGPSEEGGGGPPPALIAVGAVRDGGIEHTWTYHGEVRPLERAELAAGASGEVGKVTVREGDRVDRGELLVQVDPALAAARLDVARAEAASGAASLVQARRNLDRLRSVDPGVLAPDTLDAAEAELTSLEAKQQGLEAAARQAEAELGRHRVRAPFDGVVVRRHVDPGDWVTPGAAVVDLVSTEAVEVRADVAPEVADALAVGHPALLRGEGEIAGEVLAIVPALDPGTRTARVRIAPSGDAPWLRPGSSVDVVLSAEARSGGVVVPRDALVPGPVESRVVRVVDGVAEPVVVDVIATAAEEALVRGEGLAAGDVVVVRGNERLRAGQAVRVAE